MDSSDESDGEYFDKTGQTREEREGNDKYDRSRKRFKAISAPEKICAILEVASKAEIDRAAKDQELEERRLKLQEDELRLRREQLEFDRAKLEMERERATAMNDQMARLIAKALGQPL